MKLEHRKF